VIANDVGLDWTVSGLFVSATHVGFQILPELLNGAEPTRKAGFRGRFVMEEAATGGWSINCWWSDVIVMVPADERGCAQPVGFQAVC